MKIVARMLTGRQAMLCEWGYAQGAMSRCDGDAVDQMTKRCLHWCNRRLAWIVPVGTARAGTSSEAGTPDYTKRTERAMPVEAEHGDAPRTQVHAGLQAELEVALHPLDAYVRRRVWMYERLGMLQTGYVQPEEIINTAVLRALEGGAVRPDGQALLPWLRDIAREQLERELARAGQRERNVALDADSRVEPLAPDAEHDQGDVGREQPLVSEFAAESETPEEQLVEGEFQTTLIAILAEMPDDMLQPLLLTVRDGRPLVEVARLEGISVEEARTRVADAEETLRRRLDEAYDGEPLPDLERILEAIEATPLTGDALRHIADRLGQPSNLSTDREGA
jgi:RNA polymerase sigma factor (sigma-70 family)